MLLSVYTANELPQLPLTPGWQEIDPADYGAPDPAQLMSPDQGFSSLLTATTGVEKGDSVRGGTNNSEVLTEYTGTVSGDVVEVVEGLEAGEVVVTRGGFNLRDGDKVRAIEGA